MLNPCFIHPAQLHFPVILAAPCPSLGPSFIPIFANLFLFIAFWVAKLHDYKAVTPIRQEQTIRALLGIKVWSEIYHNKITNDNQLSHDDKENTRIQPSFLGNRNDTVYPKKYAHCFVVLCFVVVMQSLIMNSHEVFIHIHQGCFAGTGAIVRLPQCQWSKPDGYGKISQCITTTKHSKAKTVCIFLGIYCITAVMFPVTYWPTMTIHNIDHHGLETSMRFVSAVLWNIVGT